nr:tetratricopeptide repeat protein [uncultured Sphingosinicella sp.]
MRFQALLALLMVATAMPAAAQPQPTPDKRIKKLEDEMRAVQRKVFPGAGRQAILEPEIGGPQAPATPAGVPAGSAVADLTARIDALEAQLARLTGQAEESAFKLRQYEQQVTALRAEAEARQSAPVPAAAPLAAEQAPPQQAALAAAPAPVSSSGDPAEDAYLAGFRLWEQGRFAEAHKTLEAMAVQHPNHRRASWARNLAGRALLDDGKATAAAKALFANYEADPKGERAPDSLFYLGDALVKLKKTAEACKVYDELQGVYGSKLSGTIKGGLPKARAAAGCL